MNLSKLSVRPASASSEPRQASAASGLSVRAQVKAGSGRGSYNSSYLSWGGHDYRG